jgi:putative aminopeptidase FrvX
MAPTVTPDLENMKSFLIGLLSTPSPSGFTERALDYIENALAPLPVRLHRTQKGALVAEWAGKAATAPRALTAHVDTLGALVKEIKDNGRLRLTKVGGFQWNTVESEGCTVFTSGGAEVRGSLMILKASSHVYGAETGQMKRDEENMEVRLDARTTSAAETRALGIRVGDFVAFDPRVEAGPAGFIRGRYLDGKSSVAAIVGAITAMAAAGVEPAQRTTILFSHYEEVGHGGASGFPPDIVELIAVDMAAIGQGQESDEFHVTVCAKDSGGPYDRLLSQRLIALAENAGVAYKVDLYSFYGSDGGAFWRAGGDVRVALMGPGVEASHNYERIHMDGLMNAAQLLIEYLSHDT